MTSKYKPDMVLKMPKLQHLLLTVLLTAIATMLPAAPAAQGINFNKSDATLPAAAPKGVALVALDDGSQALRIPAKSSRFTLAEFPVKPDTKYRVVLRARVGGSFTIEQNDRAHIQAIRRRGRYDSVYNVTITRDGERDSYSAGGSFFLTSEWYDYTHVFRSSAHAKTAQITIETRNNQSEISGVAILPDDEGGVLNNNPDFRYGELNYCGWHPQRDGRIIERPDGKFVFRSGYGGSSPRFPLMAGKTYTLSAVGIGGSLTLFYYDTNGKGLGSRFLLRPAGNKVVSETLSPPEGCVRGGIVAYSSILESFTVVEKE